MHEWVSLAKEINELEEPWVNYGDPNLFIPEPKDLRTTLKLKEKDPIAFKLWCRTIHVELRNLISQGIFVLDHPDKKEKIILMTLVLKVKLTLKGNWDKAKACICIRGDVQNLDSQEDTSFSTSSKRAVQIFLTSVSQHNSKIK